MKKTGGKVCIVKCCFIETNIIVLYKMLFFLLLCVEMYYWYYLTHLHEDKGKEKSVSSVCLLLAFK